MFARGPTPRNQKCNRRECDFCLLRFYNDALGVQIRQSIGIRSSPGHSILEYCLDHDPGAKNASIGAEVKGSGQDTGVGAVEGMMLVAALASSVDGFALGAGLELQGPVSPWLLLSVGGGSGLASLAGLLLGSKVSCFAGGNGECFAGLVLIEFALLGWAGQWSC